MKATWYLIVHMIFSGFVVHGQSASLLIFQGMSGEPLSDAAGMNIAHQVLTGLIQKAAPMLVSIDVWNHILSRRDRCLQAMVQKNSLHAQVNRLVQDVNRKIKQNHSLTALNSQLNDTWYQKNYPMLAVLDEDQSKAVMFDYFCMHVDGLISSWTSYQLQDTYILLLPTVVPIFNVSSTQLLSSSQLLTIYPNLKFVALPKVLALLLKSKRISWNFYVTGHGHHADATHAKSMIAGMTIEQFQQFLCFLQDQVRTNILVYSSCFSSGIHLVDPYQIDSMKLNPIDSMKLSSKASTCSSLKLKYPVVATCLTDAPVYVFGMPSGLKLPPYDTSLQLEPADVAAGKLNWHLMQNFNNFVHSATSRKSLKEIAQSVMMYQECLPQVGLDTIEPICNLAKLENIPLVRRPGETFFVPIDTTYVDCIIHNKSQLKNVEGKHGLLWYIKQYDGDICFKHRIAQCISMVPGDGAIWMRGLQAPDFSWSDICKQAFFSVEDLHGVQIFLCDTLVCRDSASQIVTLQQVIVLPKSSWLPKGLPVGDGGLCCYQQDGNGYAVAVNKGGIIQVPYTLSVHQQNIVQQLWKLLRQESMTHFELSADELWPQSVLQQRQLAYEQILATCQQQAVCS